MVTIKGLTKYFEGICAVNHISLEIPDGIMFGLLGTNGAGKTTLLRMLAGILEMDEREIRIDGEEDSFSTTHKENYYKIPLLEKMDVILAPISLVGEMTGSGLFDKSLVFEYIPSATYIETASGWILLPFFLFWQEYGPTASVRIYQGLHRGIRRQERYFLWERPPLTHFFQKKVRLRKSGSAWTVLV